MKNFSKDIIVINSNTPGPTVTILAGVHGNELCGLKAFKAIIPNLKIDKGKVFFIYGNPKAIKKNARQIQINLNRAFRPLNEITRKEKQTYEFNRAQKIKKYLDKSEALLDIHSSRTKKSLPFIICEKHSLKIAKKLPVKIISHGWDKIEPGGTDYYMNTNKKIGICIECGYSLNKSATTKAIKSINNFLIATGNIKGKIKDNNYKIIKVYSVYKTKNNFKLAKKFYDFEPIPAKTLIGHDNDKEIRNNKKSLIIFPRDCTEPNSEAFILGK